MSAEQKKWCAVLAAVWFIVFTQRIKISQVKPRDFASCSNLWNIEVLPLKMTRNVASLEFLKKGPFREIIAVNYISTFLFSFEWNIPRYLKIPSKGSARDMKIEITMFSFLHLTFSFSFFFAGENFHDWS